MKRSLAGIVDRVSDENFGRVLALLGSDSQCWYWMGKPGQLRAVQVAMSLDLASASPEQISGLLQVDELAPVLIARMGELTPIEASNVVSEHPDRRFFPLALKLFEEANSYREAEAIGRFAILALAEDLTVDEMKAVLHAVQNNRQIYEAGGTGGVLLNFYELTKRHREATLEEWRQFAAFLSEQRYTSADELIQILTPS